MEKNKFEKQVQERMVDLKIQPSPKNWSAIERRIRKRRIGKRVNWLFMAALFLAAGGGYLWFQQNEKPGQEIAQQPAKELQNNQPSIGRTNTTTFPKTKINSIPETNDKNISNEAISGSKQNALGIPKKALVKSSVKKIIDRASQEPAESFTDEQLKENPAQAISIQATDLPDNIRADRINVTSFDKKDKIQKEELPVRLIKPGQNTIALEDFAISEKRNSNLDKAVSPDQMGRINLTLEKEDSDSLNILAFDKKDVDIKTEPTSLSKSKWEWGISFSAGKAILGEGINFTLNDNNKSFDLNAADPNLSPNFSQSYIVSRPAAIRISKPKSSIGFSAGLVVKKSLSKNIKLQSGLNYKYYSSTIQLSTQRVTSYIGMSINNDFYRNNFHFIELPLLAQFELNKNKKIPLYANAGMTISHLLISDAVEFKGGYFVRDAASMNKTQIGFSAGISATFFNKLSVGPFMNYGVNKVSNEGIFEEKHWNYIGLRLDYLFKK